MRPIALVSRTKRALHGGREFLVHLLELLGRVGADPVARLRDVSSKASRILAVHCACWGLGGQNPAPKGVDNRSEVLCSGAPTTGGTTRADTSVN
jgi:hypothetical protein